MKKDSISKRILQHLNKSFSPIKDSESNKGNGLIDYDNLESYVKLLIQGFMVHLVDKYCNRYTINNWDVYFKEQSYTELFSMLFSSAVAYTKQDDGNFIIFPLYIINTYNSNMRFDGLLNYSIQGTGYINKYKTPTQLANNEKQIFESHRD